MEHGLGDGALYMWGALRSKARSRQPQGPGGGRMMEAQLLCPLWTPRRFICQGLFAKILGNCTELASGVLRKTFSISARPINPRFQACEQRRFQKSNGRRKITCQRAAVLTARERFPCISAGSRVHSLATFRFCGKTYNKRMLVAARKCQADLHACNSASKYQTA